MRSNHCEHKHHHTAMRKQPSMRTLRPYPSNNQSPITVNQFHIDQYQNTQTIQLSNKKAERELRRAERQHHRLQREQYKRVDKSRQRQTSRNQYGKITNLTVQRGAGQYHQQSKYLTDTRHSIGRQLQPEVQLQYELEKQISQLYPVRKSFENLSRYHQQLTAQYNLLLAQMNVMSRLSLSSQSCPHSGQHLRELQQQYQQQSDCLNMQLIPKLTSIKQQNLAYCQHYNSLQHQLAQHKQMLNNSMLQSEILSTQHVKITQQLQTQHQHNQIISNKLHLLAQTLKQKLSIQQAMQARLSATKQKRQIQYYRQTEMLSVINQNKLKNNTLIVESSKLKEKEILAQQLYHQRAIRVQHLQNNQLKSLIIKNKQLQQKLNQSNHQTYKLQTKLSSTQQLLQNTQSALQYVTTQQIPNQQQQHDKLRQQLAKNTKFLSYLRQYQQQLKSTSNLMFQQLNASCQEDYDKLVKNKHKFIGTNTENDDKNGDTSGKINDDTSGKRNCSANGNVIGNSNENGMPVQNDNNKYVINIHYDNKKDDSANSNNARHLSFSPIQQASMQSQKTPKRQQQLKNPLQTDSRPPQQLTLNHQQPQQQSDGKLSQLYFNDQSSTRNNIKQLQQFKQLQRLSSQPQRKNSPTNNTLLNFSFNIESVQRLIQQRAQQLNGSSNASK